MVEIEVSTAKLRIRRQHKRPILACFNIEIEPFRVFVVAARHDQRVRVLRMRHVAQPHLLQVSTQSLRAYSRLLSTACADRNHCPDRNRRDDSCLHLKTRCFWFLVSSFWFLVFGEPESHLTNKKPKTAILR